MSHSINRLVAFTALLLSGSVADLAGAQTYSDVVLSGNPLFYWNFNESGDADAAIDLIGVETGDNLIAEGNATRVGGGATMGGLSLGRAASFDGSQFSKFYSGALSPATNVDAWAMEFWIRPTGADPGDRFDYIIEARGAMNNSPGILFDYGNNDVVEVFGGGGRTAGGGPALVNDAWQHIVIGNFGADNDRIDFYLNGAPAGSVFYAETVPFGTSQIAVGNSVPGHATYDHFAGEIDELAVYDLTGQSVAEISNKLVELAGHYSAVPEPQAIALFCMAMPALARIRRRRVRVS